MLNQVVLVGRLTRDVSVNKSDKGIKVATVSLAASIKSSIRVSPVSCNLNSMLSTSLFSFIFSRRISSLAELLEFFSLTLRKRYVMVMPNLRVSYFVNIFDSMLFILMRVLLR